MINVFHNYRTHDLPGLNVLTVSRPCREKLQMVVNNVEIEIERERETAHLMKFGNDGSITFPCLLSFGGYHLWSIVRLIKFSRENPNIQPRRWQSSSYRSWDPRDVELRLPTITF